ncbi:ADP-ribosylglycohydrolase family protein [soil metagenome]
MAKDKNDRVAGMVFGSLIADALALGAHWIYDQKELEKTFILVEDFQKPLADSYHPGKAAGEQTHYGDQTLVLLDSIAEKGAYDEADFFEKWCKSWVGYGDYFDHATKETLANLAKGEPMESVGSDSEELGGAARIAPLLAMMQGQPLEAQIKAVRSQTALTHATHIAQDAAEFLARLTAGVLNGHEVAVALRHATSEYYEVLPVRDILRKVAETRSLEMKDAAKELGLACPAEQALPTVLALIVRYPDDLETALVENVMAGGDSAARGLALGMILGAKAGQSEIPERWIEGLQAKAQIEEFLGKLA